ncbi:WD40 repeat-like protein [Cutaneotrichosporon oleaginosum]|uniref:Protein HIR n=1 Tax=Cutaneotrichosporon oleaginosum TaxID=879819 RepID=A0A0J0XQ85_9TREE|nr:WD40 repeat-like protein [Cutaneotrichosporon oleaginosum]KLT43237.1 WD40 repeat-like protein [Cutaneotrichosporon oleaginosum]TXT09917.1 hypothetical protein COLE_03851 [Cutaneotrichosporon oleaginosum]
MKVIKPAWVEHSTGDKQTRSPIYSISVHPDGTRLATGGQDNKVKIWNTLPILDPAAAENELNHKLLCTMSAHTGPVLTVRWAHHGRFLASGSDDSVLLIWDIDPAGGGRVFGSEEVNVENWKALRRLVGHIADVVDCAWSRDDTMLASVGLDSKIIIWDCTNNFERMITIDAHDTFVKGVTWDPVGNFLATQSDDKTVRIWNTDTWQCVEKVSKPFELSPSSTFFRRLSWSPDGAFIAASNAMNGPVFVAAVIEREGWQSDISFVGHENTIQVAAFNPRLFFRIGDEPSRVNASCMVALGADDFSVSIWRNTMHKPLTVIRDIFNRAILDLCWSNDGLSLYGCSADGTIMAVSFRIEEFPELGLPEMTQMILDEYKYKPARKRKALTLGPSSSFAAPAPGGEEKVNMLQPRKGKPKPRKINLHGTMAGGAVGANGRSSSSMSMGGSGGRAPLQRPEDNIGRSPQRPVLHTEPRGGALDAFARAADEPLSMGSSSAARAHMLEGARGIFDDRDRDRARGRAYDDREYPRGGEKRKASMSGDDDYGRPTKGRSLGPSRALPPVQEIRAPLVTISGGSLGGGVQPLPFPRPQTGIQTNQEDGNGSFKAVNVESPQGYSVTFSQGGSDLWMDFLPSPAIIIAATSQFCAVTCLDGTVRTYSTGGRQLDSFKLATPATDIVGSDGRLLILAADGNLSVIEVKSRRQFIPPTSVRHLIPDAAGGDQQPVETFLRPNGTPVLVTSEPAAWAFDRDIGVWSQIAASWWSASPLNENEGRTRNGRSGPNGPLAEIEAKVTAMRRDAPPDPKPKWWNESMACGHYETRLRGARLLGSKEEYRHWLKEYAKYLADESFRERAEDVLAELMGPIFQ